MCWLSESLSEVLIVVPSAKILELLLNFDTLISPGPNIRYRLHAWMLLSSITCSVRRLILNGALGMLGRVKQHPAQLLRFLFFADFEPATFDLSAIPPYLKNGKMLRKDPTGFPVILFILLEAAGDAAQPVVLASDVSDGVAAKVL